MVDINIAEYLRFNTAFLLMFVPFIVYVCSIIAEYLGLMEVK